MEMSPAHRSPTTKRAPPELAFNHGTDRLFPACSVLTHALVHGDYLAVPVLVDSDGDQHADVPHAPAPGTLVPHAVHEHIRVFALRRPVVPLVDLAVHALELVGEHLRGHAVAPQ